jgi:hypothetical protein
MAPPVELLDFLGRWETGNEEWIDPLELERLMREVEDDDQKLLRRQWLALDPAERQRLRLELRRMAPGQRDAWLQRLRQGEPALPSR